jgi:alkylglycerol monooxygenase
MKINLLGFAVPLFTAFILLEYWLSKKKQRKLHSFEESVANLNIGIAERMTDLLTTGAFYLVFSWIYNNHALFHIKPNAFTWILLFIATDALWYWYHRCGHTINLFWSVHVVHHQSEDFNYTVSTRITLLQAIARGLFWSVLPLIGFPVGMIMLFLLIHGTYPFFTHTQLIGKLGWIEYIFVTPSHHRVHHSSNPEYLDKNYGDILIIWDKLFGTFAEEKTEIRYGLTRPLNSYSFLWQYFHFQLELLVAFGRAKGIHAKWKIMFGKPDDIDPAIRHELEDTLLARQHGKSACKNLHTVITIQTIVTMLILFVTILWSAWLSPMQLCVIALFVLISVINTGAMMEQKRWVFYFDFTRIAVTGIFVYSSYPLQSVATLTVILLSIILLFYKSIQNHYYGYLYQYA